MASVIKLPQFGHAMQEGIIVSIFVAEGAKIEKGDRVAEVETNKTTLEIESSVSGFLRRILVEVGENVNINRAIMIVGDKEEQISDEFIDSVNVGVELAPVIDKEEDISTSPEVFIGPFASTTEGDLKLGSRIAVSEDRRAIVEGMHKSKLDKPCFYLRAKVDITDLMDLCRSGERFDKRIWLESYVIRAVALGIKEFKSFNSFFKFIP